MGRENEIGRWWLMQSALKDIVSSTEYFITKHQAQRDEFNAKVVENKSRREQVNGQKREIYDEIERQRTVRDKENTMVREAKSERETANKEFNTLRIKIHGADAENKGQRRGGDSPEFIRKKMNKLEMDHMIGKINDKKFLEQINLLKNQLRVAEEKRKPAGGSDENSELDALRVSCDAAHSRVIAAAEAAQAAHDLMGKLNDETRRLNDEHELAHRAFVAAKVEADREHQYYIVAMRCIWSSRHLLKAAQDRADGVQPSKADALPANVDLMSALMAGKTLSTEQLMTMRRED
ncbi:MAG TPA: hypothetical protein EYM81_05390 [Candidatus Poseidoniales archaeon]|nr:hypothetical protein [Candidatus Poseidoniales archaeon]HIB23387.1 hypothetical protein [Candidatus Poseidoniales archaeon]HIN45199.1 hypothetical protein [Candidatus Poseidoniales archaeon]HIO24569.1 hypothetical protein [Candidatus Poseidoniales archaeon]